MGTHDIEWLPLGAGDIPLAGAVRVFASPAVIAAGLAPVVVLPTVHDIEPSGFGFDVAVAVGAGAFGPGDGVLFAFDDPHAEPGIGEPIPVPELKFYTTIIIPAPGTLLPFALGGMVGKRRRRRAWLI